MTAPADPRPPVGGAEPTKAEQVAVGEPLALDPKVRAALSMFACRVALDVCGLGLERASEVAGWTYEFLEHGASTDTGEMAAILCATVATALRAAPAGEHPDTARLDWLDQNLIAFRPPHRPGELGLVVFVADPVPGEPWKEGREYPLRVSVDRARAADGEG